MKKLLSSAALAGLLAVAAAPAMAQGDQSALKLDLGGYFRGYMAYTSQDTRQSVPAAAVTVGTNASERNIDILRDTEVHFTGETTLDNGLTVGVHVEAASDMGDGFAVDESYMYTSGSWGRINFGGEDGASYLLQVAAPSADSNIDGIRQYINGFNYNISPSTAHTPTAGVTSTPFSFANIDPTATAQLRPATLVAGIYTAPVANSAFDADASADADTDTWGRYNGVFLQDDYAQDATRFADKLSYLSPVFNGFQAGVSYTPDVTSGVASRGLNGVGADNVINSFGDAWDLAARYEGQFDQFGLTLGAGYTHIDLENERAAQLVANGAIFQGLVRNAFTDDRDIWNVGGTVTVGGFGFGALYTEDDRGSIAQDDGATRVSYTSDSDSQTYVLGADYTTGPWKVGASYLNREVENMAQRVTGAAGTFVGYDDLETDRYSGGLTYTYGPGMTFRGSVHYIEHEVGTSDADATTFVLGTQVNF